MLLTIAHRAALVVAMLLCVVAAALLVAEHTGWLASRARAELRAALGDDADLGSARLDWFAPAIELDDVELGADSGELRLERVRVRLGWRDGGFAPARIDLRGGRVLLSDRIVERAEALGAERADRGAAQTSTPTVVVSGLQLDLLHPRLGEIEVGVVDALWRADERGSPRIEGRVTPTFSAAPGARSPSIFLAGSRDAQGVFEIVVACAGIPVDARALPRALREHEVTRWNPRANLEFELSARFQLDPDAPAEGAMRARLDGGSLAPPNSAAVQQIAVDVDARCSAPSASRLLDPAMWRTIARASARWNQTPLEAHGMAGANAGPGLAARAWVLAPKLPLEERFLREAGLYEMLEPNWTPLSPRGSVDALVGVRWPTADSFADTRAAARPQVAAELRMSGETGVTFHGWPRRTGEGREGFPAPVDQIVGRAIALHDPDADHAAMLALLEVLGAHSSGARTEQPAFIEGLIRFGRRDPAATTRVLPAFDLRIGAHGFPVDARMRTALLSLLPDDLVWRQFAPSGGHVSATVRLARAPGGFVPAADVRVDLFDVSGAWRPGKVEADDEAPPELPLRNVNGSLSVLADPRIAIGVAFELTGAAAQRAEVRISGRTMDDATQAYAPERWRERRMQEIVVRARHVGLGGADRETVERVWPQIAREVARREASGWADLEYRGATLAPGGPLQWRVEVTPRTTELSPEEFRVAIRNVRGRVIVEGLDPFAPDQPPPAANVRIAPLLGDTLGGAGVACNALIEADGAARVEVLAAGVSPSNPGIVGAFKHAFERTARGGQSGLSLSALQIDGRVDLSGVVLSSPITPARPVSSFRVHLRDNDIQTTLEGGRFRLDRLVGVLESRPEELRGARLSASLAGAPIELRNARFFERDGRSALETDFQASNLALDREHLSMFLAPRTVDVLLDERGLRGVVDVRAARLVLESEPGRPGAVRLTGEITPRTLEVDLGLPLKIESGRFAVHELTYEADRVRARATLHDVRGRMADRKLLQTRIELVYDDPTLTIEDVQGVLEGGILSRLDPRGERPAFRIDLHDPFAFRLGLALERAEVGGLLAGLFESEFLTRGRVTARLELDGDLDRMSAITGRGRVDLRDSNLWSVPVVRNLVSQFGLDSKSAVFDSIQSRFTIADGEVRMSELDISSPYFGVSGDGVLGFDGSLRQDFEVRNTVVNLLGPIKNVLYRIAIRGDMARPRVETYGVLGQTFREPPQRMRALPLPPLSALPARF